MGNHSVRLLLGLVIGFSLSSPSAAQVGNTWRVSVSSSGTQANSSSGVSFAASDGRYIAFASGASNLVPNDTNVVTDVFVYDRATGYTYRESVSSAEEQGNIGSWDPAVTPDGRYVAFQSEATNLVSGDTNGFWDVFVRDRQTGETTRVSVSSSGEQANDIAWVASISDDGRFVAFHSYASNLAPGDTNTYADVFLHDRQTGQTTRASESSTGQQANGACGFATLSANGRYIAFHSSASTLVTGDTNGVWDVFVRDRQTGQVTRESLTSSGGEGNGDCLFATISADGQSLVFRAAASNLVSGDTNAAQDIFVRDRRAGTTVRVSVSSSGQEANGISGEPYEYSGISSDGRYSTFRSAASNLVAGDTNNVPDVFVHDRQTGETRLVSVSSSGVHGDYDSIEASISADGRFVSFTSVATNLVSGDTNNTWDIFVHHVHDVAEARPSSYSLFRGVLVSGGLQDMHFSDDSRLVARPGIVLSQAEAPVQVVLTGYAPAVAIPSELRFILEAHCNIPNIGQRIELYNFTAGAYEQVDFRTATVSDSVVEVVITTNASRFVTPATGTMQARIGYKAVGPVFSYPWFARIDQAMWRLRP